MKYQTALQCFGLLFGVAIAAFMSEAVFSVMTERDTPQPHYALPITSLPYVWNRINAEKIAEVRRAEERAREDARPHMTVTLKNGSKMTGKLVNKEGDWVTLKVDGDEIGFHSSEIINLEKVSAQPAGQS